MTCGHELAMAYDHDKWITDNFKENPMETKTTDETLTEHVKVQTEYVGQHLRVTLVRRNLPRRVDGGYGQFEDTVQAELIIEAGTRVTIGRDGVKVEEL